MPKRTKQEVEFELKMSSIMDFSKKTPTFDHLGNNLQQNYSMASIHSSMIVMSNHFDNDPATSNLRIRKNFDGHKTHRQQVEPKVNKD